MEMSLVDHKMTGFWISLLLAVLNIVVGAWIMIQPVIGVYVGVDVLLTGWNMILFSFALKNNQLMMA